MSLACQEHVVYGVGWFGRSDDEWMAACILVVVGVWTELGGSARIGTCIAAI